MHKKVGIINGPNLNLLGQRQSDIYGDISFNVFLKKLQDKYEGVDIRYFQSNIEGELINEIQNIGFNMDGIILNAGAYTHTSVAIGDAVAAIKCPVIEVHISNVFSREDFRKFSYLSSVCVGQITGLGLSGYELALRYFLEL
ncbi:MAG: type II 3-dehydroquinate dehydratase [Bacteroidetes bacterium]|nr:type II 3-dehydroquinate dehydratase [Bacteroidota bacterium]